MIDRLRRALAGAGYDLGPDELLDVLWLAGAAQRAGVDRGRHVTDASAASGPPADRRSPSAERDTATAGPEPDPEPEPPRRPDPPGHGEPPAGRQPADRPSPARRSLFPAGSDSESGPGEAARPGRAPGGRTLPHAQRLARAVRPLHRYRRHPHRVVADIPATVRLTAETGLLDVVSRPDRERAWAATLLVDDSPSMRAWSSLAAEVRSVLDRSGAFRSVRARRVDPRRIGRPPDGELTFLLTDGVSGAWRSPRTVRELAGGRSGGPVVVLHALPRRLWRGTGVDAEPRLLLAKEEFSRVRGVRVLDPLTGAADEEDGRGTALPVLALTPSAFTPWVSLLTRPGSPRLVETVLSPTEPPADTAPPAGRPADELLTSFRAAFSPEAYRLAVHLAAVRPLTAPVMHLVRAATLPDATATHVAEVLLGGLLEQVERPVRSAAQGTLARALGTPTDEPVYEFRPGVRDLLFSGLGVERSIAVAEAVGRSLEPYLGRLPDFPALVADPGGHLRLAETARAFAVLVSPVLDRLARMGRMAGDDEAPTGPVPAADAGHATRSGQDQAGDPPSQDPHTELRFALLGPVRAWRGPELLSIGPAHLRALLCALLLNRDRTVTQLVDAVWEDAPPAALATVHSYLSRLRRALGPGTPLAHRASRYSLEVPRTATDVGRAAELEAAAETASAAGDPRRARELLGAALDLWRGEALTDVPGPYAARERAALAEWRLELLGRRLALDLELGEHARRMAELTALVAEHPRHEGLRALLMLALYRCGRPAEALAAYTDARETYADDTGPGRELTRLYEHMVHGRPDQMAPWMATPPEPAHDPVRSRAERLPPVPSPFVGRDEPAGRLAETLVSSGGETAPVALLLGPPGVGKTALAARVAQTVGGEFPDGRLYADLGSGTRHPADPTAVLASFLRALGSSPGALPDDPDALRELYRGVLAGLRVLVVLDNVDALEQVRDLLPRSAGSAALLIGRPGTPIDWRPAGGVRLTAMDDDEAVTCLSWAAGTAEPSDAHTRAVALRVVAACGRLPLALRVAGRRIAHRGDWPAAALEWGEPTDWRAGDATTVEERMAAVLDAGYRRLPSDLRRAVRLLSVPALPWLTDAALAAVLDLPRERAGRVSAEIVASGLLDTWGPGRLRFHDLVWEHAHRWAEEEDRAARVAVLGRLVAHYLATAVRARAAAADDDHPLDHLWSSDGTAPPGDGPEGTSDWLDAEGGCLLQAVRQAASAGAAGWRDLADLLLVAGGLAGPGPYAREYGRVATLVADGARQAGEGGAEGRARLATARAHARAGRWSECETAAIAVLSVPGGEPLVRGAAALERGVAAVAQRRWEEAEKALAGALRVFQAEGDRQGESAVLAQLSRTELAQRRIESAVALAERGVAVCRDGGNSPRRLADSRYTLAVALAADGRPDEALDQLAAALPALRLAERWSRVALTHLRMAEAQLAAGRPAAAAASAERALADRDDTLGPGHRANVLVLLGRALAQLGHHGRARACWQEALDRYERLGSVERTRVRGLLRDHPAPAGSPVPPEGAARAR